MYSYRPSTIPVKFCMDDFSVLLAEYNKIINSSTSLTDSPAVIPILLKHGAFTPSRLERWSIPAILAEMQSDASYRDRFIQSFNQLISVHDAAANDAVTLNEKKGVALLLATKELLHEFLYPTIKANQRFLLIAIEYSVLPLELCLNLSLPVAPNCTSIAPKLKSKYPLLISVLQDPNITHAKDALHRLQACPSDLEAKLALSCACRVLNSRLIYSEIVQAVWNSENTENPELIKSVLEAVSHCSDLKAFCEKYLSEE